MNKFQFWALNCFSIALAAVLLAHYLLTQHNDQLGQTLDRDQTVINNARQVEQVLNQLAKRIALGSDTDPQLKNILTKYGMSVTLVIDGKNKNYP